MRRTIVLTQITPADMSRMAYDQDGHLYWDGKPIVTDARLALTKAQNWFAIAIGISAILGGIASFLQAVTASCADSTVLSLF